MKKALKICSRCLVWKGVDCGWMDEAGYIEAWYFEWVYMWCELVNWILNANLDGVLLIQSVISQYAFEVLFRSQQYALMDNGCREYIFLTEFFMVHDADAMKLFMTVMGKTLQHVQVSGFFMTIWCLGSPQTGQTLTLTLWKMWRINSWYQQYAV